MTTQPSELCRRIASKTLDWAQPGAQCRDPQTGQCWVITRNTSLLISAVLSQDYGTTQRFATFPKTRKLEGGADSESFYRAVQAGPDPDCTRTMLGLIALLPQEPPETLGQVWARRVYQQLAFHHGSLHSEIILDAVLNHLGD